MKIQVSQPRLQHFNLTQQNYQEMYQESIEHPHNFFANQAKLFLDWFQSWDHIISGRFQAPPVYWFMNGQLNMSYNCIDRHLPQYADKTAIIWEGNSSAEQKTYTYQQLHDEVCRIANILKSNNIQKGDVVCIYMPMIPEAIFAMLACCRIGAIHNVIFGGFSSQSLANRIQDSKAKFLFTANAAYRGKKLIPFKDIVDDALKDCPSIKHVLVVQRTDYPTKLHSNRDLWYQDALKNVDKHCPAEPMLSQDPLFILYTSGSTGKPKGIVHGTGGYALHVAMSYYYLFNQQAHTKHWCTADIGWITGHSYTVYGPLLNASTTVIYESVPNYPNFSRYPEIIERYQVTNFYTAPTALRSLRHEGNAIIESFNLSSLELLGSVGEPINPEVWLWYFETFGQKRCPIINTWWQTESGGILLSPLPSDPYFIPGAAGKPFFGISPQINKKNILYIQHPWPGLLQTIFNDKQRLIDSYLPEPELGYLTGDGATHIDEQIHIQGRLDDVIKVSGHRLGTEELESAFVEHIAVSESAVIGTPHPIKGEAIIAFIVPQKHIQCDNKLTQLLKTHIRQSLGPIAQPEHIIWVNNLPKTRSGKIMRRILKKISSHDLENFGDTSSLAEPHVIKEIIHAFEKQT
jgi:acetyl-CoA synthetase